tara:strand:- start:12396 stop:12725 length:330 start_codon:yes stop_codon:yes gene_type:complete
MTACWYLIQYDIRNPRRLQRIHRLLKRTAIALQESVFAWHGNTRQLGVLKRQLRQHMDEQEDDIRGYRLQHPLLLFGESPFTEECWFDGYPPHRLCPHIWLRQPPAALW